MARIHVGTEANVSCSGEWGARHLRLECKADKPPTSHRLSLRILSRGAPRAFNAKLVEDRGLENAVDDLASCPPRVTQRRIGLGALHETDFRFPEVAKFRLHCLLDVQKADRSLPCLHEYLFEVLSQLLLHL
jgi:hypothetical protein